MMFTPVNLITGFLGSGKTSLLQAVTREVCGQLRKGEGGREKAKDEVPLLVDEVPHVVSSRLKSSIADAAEVVGQASSEWGEEGRGGWGQSPTRASARTHARTHHARTHTHTHTHTPGRVGPKGDRAPG